MKQLVQRIQRSRAISRSRRTRSSGSSTSARKGIAVIDRKTLEIVGMIQVPVTRARPPHRERLQRQHLHRANVRWLAEARIQRHVAGSEMTAFVQPRSRTNRLDFRVIRSCPRSSIRHRARTRQACIRKISCRNTRVCPNLFHSARSWACRPAMMSRSISWTMPASIDAALRFSYQ